MGFLNYGSAKGLSFQNDFERDTDRLYQREAYRSQVQAEKEQKTKYYAGLMKEHPATAPSMVKALEPFYKDLNNKLADFAINNPNFETDVNKMQEFLGITDQYLNNDFVRKDMQSQEQFKLLQNAYNEGKITKGKWEEEMNRYTDFQENGGDSYTFSNPKTKEMSDILKEINTHLAPTVIRKTEGVKIIEHTFTDPERIKGAARLWYSNEENKMAIDSAWNGLTKEERGSFENNQMGWLEARIASGEEVGDQLIGYDKLYEDKMKTQNDNAAGLASYHRFYIGNVLEPLQANGETPADKNNIAFTEFGDLKQPLPTSASGRNVKVYDPENPGQLKTINLSGNVSAIGAGKIKNIGGVPFVEVSVAIMSQPEAEAKDATGTIIQHPVNYTQAQIDAMPRSDRKAIEKGLKDIPTLLENTKYKDELVKNGFNLQKITDLGMQLGLDTNTVSGDVMTGTILMPANFAESNRIKYDKSYNTTDNVAKAAQLYNEDLHTFEMIKSNNAPVVSSKINTTAIKDINYQFLEEKIGRNVEDLSWSKDPNNDLNWYSSEVPKKDSDGNVIPGQKLYAFKYDFTTGITSKQLYTTK
jgi:hypothetical protein